MIGRLFQRAYNWAWHKGYIPAEPVPIGRLFIRANIRCAHQGHWAEIGFRDGQPYMASSGDEEVETDFRSFEWGEYDENDDWVSGWLVVLDNISAYVRPELGPQERVDRARRAREQAEKRIRESHEAMRRAALRRWVATERKWEGPQ